MISPAHSPKKPLVVGLGEALFDCFPGRTVLGGAPVNFAFHAHQLLAPAGGEGTIASRIGTDDLAEQLVAELTGRGVPVDYLQRDEQHPTGRVIVELDSAGQPSYAIQENVAWDFLEPSDDLTNLAHEVNAVCFGTLAQRNPASRRTIYRFLDEATTAVRVLDVNLRGEYYDADVLEASLSAANIVKLNEEELPLVCRLTLGETSDDTDEQAHALLASFELRLLALTRGPRGTALYDGTEIVTGAPVSYPHDDNADSVGAGDACTAGLVAAVLSGWSLSETVALANHMGAFVASQPGGTPRLPAVLRDSIASGQAP